MSGSEVPRAPVRPSVPPLAWVAAALWAGEAAAESAWWRLHASGRPDAAWAVGVGALMCIASAMACARARRGALALAAVGLAAGVIVGGLYWEGWAASAAAIPKAGSQRWTAEVTGDPTQGRFGASSTGRVLGPVQRGARIVIEWPDASRPARLGQVVEALGTVKPDRTDAWGHVQHQAGVVGSLRARQVRTIGWGRSPTGVLGPVRSWAVEQLGGVPGPGGDLLASVLVGDKTRLADTPAADDFKTAGLSHLTTTSGMHLIVIAAVAGWLLGMTRCRRIVRSGIVVALMSTYAALAAFHPSAVRACVVAAVGAVAWQAGRRADGLAALSVAVVAMLVTSPASGFEVGFALSVLGVAGIVVFARLVESWLSAALPRFANVVAAPLALTVTAQLATAPVAVPAFGIVSLVAPVANLVAAPAIIVATVAGFGALLLSAVVPLLGSPLLLAAGTAASLVATIAHALASLPHAAIAVVAPAVAACGAAAGLSFALWACWPVATRRRARCGIAALALCLGLAACRPAAHSGPEIVVMDVGQGDSILLRDGAAAMLVDVGPTPEAERAALAREHVARVDEVVVTHLHDDHYGGLPGLHGIVSVGGVDFPAGSFVRPNRAVDEARKLVGGERVREVSAGDRFAVGSMTAQVLWPTGPVPDAATNEASVVLLVRRKTFSAVLTGDAESQILDALVCRGELRTIDVLKIGHHGSAGAVTPALLGVLQPKVSIISVGAGNKFGHPTRSTLDDLATCATRVLRTDQAGDVTVDIGDSSCAVKTSRGGPGTAAGKMPVTMTVIRGGAAVPCATLVGVRRALASAGITRETHGDRAVRSQTRLPHLRSRGPPTRAGPDTPEDDGRCCR